MTDIDALIARAQAHLKDLDGRCLRCGWPLKPIREHGCVPGNCAWRGSPASDPSIPKMVRIDAELLDQLARECQRLKERVTQLEQDISYLSPSYF